MLPRNPFPFTSQVFQAADTPRRSAGNFPQKSSWHLLGSPCSPASGVSLPQAASPGPLGLTKFHIIPSRSPKTVTEQKQRFGCLPPKKSNVRRVLVRKERGFIQVLHNLEEWWTSFKRRRKTISFSCSYSDREGGCFFFFFPLYSYLSNFQCAWVLPIHLFSFGVLGF